MLATAALAACSSSSGSSSAAATNSASPGGTATNSANSGGQSGASSSSALPASIPITLIADKSGVFSLYGTQLEAGVRTGIAEVEQSGILKGATFDLTVKDAAGTLSGATTAMAAAVTSHPVAIFGPTISGEALSTAPAAQSAKIPYLVATAPTGITAVGPYVYSMTTGQAAQVPALGIYLANTAKVKKVTVIYAGDNASEVDADHVAKSEFPKAGLQLIDNISTTLTQTDYTSVATKAANDKPDAIGVFGGGPMMANVTKAVRDAGFTGQLFGTMGADGTIEAAGTGANGFLYPVEWAAGATGQASADFASQFKKAYPGTTPYYMAVDGYNDVMFLAQALARAQSTDSAKVVAAMQSIAATGLTVPGGQGTFTGTGNRQFVDPTVIAELRNGKITVASAS